jgi:hypothetical protein
MDWFRLRAFGIAATLLLSLAALHVSVSSPHGDDCHDAGCIATIVEHDAAAHRAEAPSTTVDSRPLHCLVCHWAQSFRPRITRTFVATLAVQASIYVDFDLVPVGRNTQVAQPPLRSPPASPLT